jgi:hypothetical protein
MALVSLLGVLGFAGGCTSVIYKEYSIDGTPPISLSVDARQRLVLVTDRGGPDGKRRVVCAEPSPDVFGTLAMGSALNVSLPSTQQEVGAATSLAETASALALRTQTIQLLRDGLYRACEAYLNGILDEDDYRQIIKGYDELLITMLAVEGLTQQVPPIVPRIAATASAAKGETPTTSAGPAETVAAQSGTRSTVDAKVAEQVHELVRDYYCFQIGLKQLFYAPPKFGPIGKDVLDRVCATKATSGTR